MTIRTLSAIALVTAAVSGPVFAQDTAQRPAHTLRHYRSTYNQVQAPDFVAPRAGAYGDSSYDNGFDRSRIGDYDPSFNPSGS